VKTAGAMRASYVSTTGAERRSKEELKARRMSISRINFGTFVPESGFAVKKSGSFYKNYNLSI
jgi:hypothetical protein